MRSSGSSSAPTITSRSRSTRGRSWRESRPCCAVLMPRRAAAVRSRSVCCGSTRAAATRTSGSVGSRSVPREFDLLVALARDPGVVLTRDALLEDVWGTDFPGETRTVDVHIAEVRKALALDGPEIETARGYG